MNIIVKKSITNNEFRDFNFFLFKFLFSVVMFIFYYVTIRERQLSQNVMISTDPDYVSNYSVDLTSPDQYLVFIKV